MVKVNLSDINVPELIADIWSPLNDEQREFLANHFTLQNYKKNEVIHCEGETPTHLMCLLSGKVKIYKDGVGGDTACEEAVYLAGLAAKVYLIVRKPYLRASKIMQERVMKHDKIEVLFEHNAVGLFGENGVEGVHLVQRMGEPDEKRYDVAIDGFFLAIGHKPNSDIFKPYVDTDEVGYIVTEPGTPRTKVPGVFAAGDVADPHYRQAITAAGTGCQAAIEAERYLSAKGVI